MNPNTFHTDLARKASVAELVHTYQQASLRVAAAYTELQEAQDQLRAGFGAPDQISRNFDDIERNDYGEPGERLPAVLARLKCNAWQALAERIELRRLLSIAAAKELDKQMHNPQALPELTVANVLAWLESTAANADQYLQAAVREVFDWLRPNRSRYKTNSEFEIGPRVILSYALERQWNGRGFNVSYHKRDHIRALDNVFHLLDGRGAIKSYSGELADAIHTSPNGRGATAFFRFTCYRNQNLHLEFVRLDLLAKLNAAAGGMNLKPQN